MMQNKLNKREGQKVIGLTGGIGSGKSTVSRILSEEGFPIVDADEIARHITEQSIVLENIQKAFGEHFVIDGSLDRKALGRLVFSDPVALETLESITHPAITKEILSQIAALFNDDYQVVILDAPLLFEAGLDRYCDITWLVSVNIETQIERILKRDDLTLEEIKKRIDAQMPLYEKAKRADVIIDNNDSIDVLRCRVAEILKKI